MSVELGHDVSMGRDTSVWEQNVVNLEKDELSKRGGPSLPLLEGWVDTNSK